ncbi:MAG TPA: dienelactone hydrolase family protein [Smithella sp.]|nr:dienelactone hydrolase family protein [Smithella sp.]
MKETTVHIPVGNAVLEGDLAIPPKSQGIVIFAHGSGSSRFSSRNKYVAEYLQREGFATLLFDLLTPEEERIDNYNMEYRFNIKLLTVRLSGATLWITKHAPASKLAVGYFGASTGAAAALAAENDHHGTVKAVVSRGGRPDLAGGALPQVLAPTLFIVGGEDHQVLDLNEQAMAKMRAVKELSIVPGATHLFEEPGALKTVSGLALGWFQQYLKAGKS